jgi:hypothetical protein
MSVTQVIDLRYIAQMTTFARIPLIARQQTTTIFAIIAFILNVGACSNE